MTRPVVHDLYTKALEQIYLKLEDVLITGTVADLVNVTRINASEFVNDHDEFKSCELRKLISIHDVNSNEQFDLWKKLLERNVTC